MNAGPGELDIETCSIEESMIRRFRKYVFEFENIAGIFFGYGGKEYWHFKRCVRNLIPVEAFVTLRQILIGENQPELLKEYREVVIKNYEGSGMFGYIAKIICLNTPAWMVEAAVSRSCDAQIETV